MMARVKAYQAPHVKADNEHDSTTPSRRTRRQTKSRVENQNASDLEVDETQGIESARVPSSPPIAKPKAKRTSRKSNPAKASADIADGASPGATSKLAKDGRRKGGNKRKFTHEYCLTCEHYGRACLGRRDDEPGCSMCREPDRDKGEKLRECLWADPDAGIVTYMDAREALKKAQAEAKVQKPRAPRRSVTVTHLNRASPPSFNYLNAPDPLGIVPDPQATRSSRPPLSRPLDVRPPSNATGIDHPSSMSGHHAYTPQAMAQSRADDSDTITVNASRHARNRSQHDLPGVHPPQVIDLPNGNGTYDEHSRRASMPEHMAQPIHYFTPPTLPTGRLTPLPESFAPFYQPSLHAYVLPVHPYSNLLPPPAFMRPHADIYISPYDADPSLSLSTNGRDPPRAVFPPRVPPRNTGFSIPAPLNVRSKKARPFVKSDIPCNKWSRSDSKVTTLSGHEFINKGWARGANDGGSGSASTQNQDPDIVVSDGAGASTNAVSIETSIRKSVDSSELSSAMDVDEHTPAATLQNNDEHIEADTIEVTEISVHDDEEESSINTPQHSDTDEPEPGAEDEEEGETDRAPAFIKQLYNEKINGLKRQRLSSPKATPPPAEKPKPAGLIAVNHGSDPALTESEGEHKEQPARANAFAAVNSKPSTKQIGKAKGKHVSSRNRSSQAGVGGDGEMNG